MTTLSTSGDKKFVSASYIRPTADPTQKRAIEETKAIFPTIHQKIEDAIVKLEQQLVGITGFLTRASSDHIQEQNGVSAEDKTKAEESIANAKKVAREGEP